jgi:hypothetical protein
MDVKACPLVITENLPDCPRRQWVKALMASAVDTGG